MEGRTLPECALWVLGCCSPNFQIKMVLTRYHLAACFSRCLFRRLYVLHTCAMDQLRSTRLLSRCLRQSPSLAYIPTYQQRETRRLTKLLPRLPVANGMDPWLMRAAPLGLLGFQCQYEYGKGNWVTNKDNKHMNLLQIGRIGTPCSLRDAHLVWSGPVDAWISPSSLLVEMQLVLLARQARPQCWP